MMMMALAMMAMMPGMMLDDDDCDVDNCSNFLLESFCV